MIRTSAKILIICVICVLNAHAAPETPMRRLVLPTEQQFAFKDYKQTTVAYLAYMFDEANVYRADNGDHGGYMEQIRTRKIGRYTSQGTGNITAYFKSQGADEVLWGIPAYIGANTADTEPGEGINVLAAIMSGGLVGLPLHRHNVQGRGEFNFVRSAVAYYQLQNGERIVLNNPSARTGQTFWYELLPGVLFCVIADKFPSEKNYLYGIVTEMARQWHRVVVGLGGADADFNWTAYSLQSGKPVFNGKWREPDAAAGVAYILYAAYALNTRLKSEGVSPPDRATDAEIAQFRQGAVWCMDFLERRDASPFYEVLTFLAPYLAARMNAEQGTRYNVGKMLAWSLDGSAAREGWGMVTENWGASYTSGLMGSLTDGGGYAFVMNTFDAMLGFAPMVKYDVRFAPDIARWVLCVSQSARAFYPEMYPDSGDVNDYFGRKVWNGHYQSGRWIRRDDPAASFIAYEGLRRFQRSVRYDAEGKRFRAENNTSYSPYASGDAYTFNWNSHTDYGLYGSSHVGLFGATIRQVVNAHEVPMILETDLDALDIFSNTRGTRHRLYFNPYPVAKEVVITVARDTHTLYNAVTQKPVPATTPQANQKRFTLAAGETAVIIEKEL